MSWVARRTEADADILWTIEGAAAFGTLLASHVTAVGYPVAEAPRMEAKYRHGLGKSDDLDTHHLARAVLSLPVAKLRR